MGKVEGGRNKKAFGGDRNVQGLNYGDEFKGVKIHYIVHFKYVEFIMSVLSIKAVLKKQK